MTDDRILTGARKPEDVDAALRPKTLDDFVGQKGARENLRIFINAAKARANGFELETTWRTTPALTLGGSLSLLDAKYTSFPDVALPFGTSILVADPAQRNTVTVINRSAEFATAKPANVQLLAEAERDGRLEVIRTATTTAVEARRIRIETRDGERRRRCDRVIARIGAAPPRSFVEA